MSKEWVRNEIMKEATRQRAEVTSIIKGQSVAITADSWSSFATMAFSNLTAHFINSEWESIDLPIGCFSDAGMLNKVEWDKHFRQVLDNCGVQVEATNAVVANNGMPLDGWEWIGCIHHFIDLLTNIVMDDEDIKATMQRAMETGTSFADSREAEEQLDYMQVSIDPTAPPLKVIWDMGVGWWSAHAYLERLLALKPAIQASVDGTTTPSYLYDDDWNSIAGIVYILKLFKDIQPLLDAHTYVPLSFAPVIVSKIRKGLVKLHQDSICSAHLKGLMEKMVQTFEENFGSGDDGTVFREHMNRDPSNNLSKGIPRKTFVAMALDPRTKTLPTLCADDKTLVWDALHDDLCLEITTSRNKPINDGSASNAHSGEAVPMNRVSEKGLLEDLFDQNEDDDYTANDVPVHVIAQNELTLYKHFKSLPMLDNDGTFSNPLVWWKMNERALPFLAKLARRTLNIPAAAVSSKSVLTSTGVHKKIKRSRFRSNVIEATVFLHDCWNTAVLHRPERNDEDDRTKRARISSD